MSNSDKISGKIIIVLCNGNSAAGLLVRTAAQKMVLAGTAQWNSNAFLLKESTKSTDTGTQSIIVVSGCDKNCLFNEKLKNRFNGTHQLVLIEVGIEPVWFDDITRDDIDLVKEPQSPNVRLSAMSHPLFSPDAAAGRVQLDNTDSTWRIK